MKYNFLPVVFTIAALLSSCGNNQQAEESVKDTAVAEVPATAPATVSPTVDTAAIIAAYEAANAKTKSVNKKPQYKEKKKKKVAEYTEPAIQSYDPANEVADAQGYNYVADKNATYPGGQKAFDKYFYNNFEYPEQAIENDIQGTIYAEIFINEQGYVERVEFPGHKLEYGLEEEAKRVIMATKKLDPAIKNGAPAKERYVLPITVVIR